MTAIEFTYLDYNRELSVEIRKCGTITVTEKEIKEALVQEITVETLLRLIKSAKNFRDISNNIPSDIISLTLNR